MDLHQIEYMIAIEQEQSISRAAEKLFITQSALNQQLLKLEQEHHRPWLKPRLTRVTASEPLPQQAHSHQGSLPTSSCGPPGTPACSCLCIWAMWSQGHPHEGLPHVPQQNCP